MSRERIGEILLRLKELEDKVMPECRTELNLAMRELRSTQNRISHIYETVRDHQEEQKQLEIELRTLMTHYINDGHTNYNQRRDGDILLQLKDKESVNSQYFK